MLRLVLTSFDVEPTKNDYYILEYRDDFKKYSRTERRVEEYTTEGGWNTYIRDDGTCFADYAWTADEMKRQFKGWYRPVYIGEEKWADTIATLLDEVATEKSATEPTEGEEIGRYELLDELQGYLEKALDFAEGAEE